jgi:hypothetical protein
VGADQHITDPDDRADLAVRAYELYNELGSLAKVREALSIEPVTLRVCGERRLFSRETIREWIGEGRAAETYIELLSVAQERADSNARLSLYAATAWEVLRKRCQTAGEALQALDLVRKIERDRMDLLGLKAPIKVQQVGGDDEHAVPPDMVATIAALARQAAAKRAALIDDAYPDAPGTTVLPARRSPRGTQAEPRKPRRRAN